MPLMSAGRHPESTCTGSALQKASTGTLQIVLSWQNQEGEHLNTYHYVTPAAWVYAEELLVKLGWDPVEHDDDLSQLNAVPSPLLNAKATVIVKEEEDPQTGQVRLKGMVFADGPALMDAGEAKKTADDFRVNLRAWSSRNVTPRPNAAPRGGAPAVAKPSDVPF